MRPSRKSILTLCCLGVIAFSLSSCGKKNTNVVATIGDREITLGEFNVAHKAITVFSRPPLLTYEDKERFLESLINKEVLVMGAREMGLEQDEKVVQVKSQAEFEYALRALYKEVVDADLEVTLPEVKEHYLKTKARVRARHIQVATRELAEELRTKVEGGADFGELAKQYSMDEATARVGGDIGFVDESGANQTVKLAAMQLGVDEVSNVVASSVGHHIIQATFRQDPSMDDFEEQRHLSAAEVRNLKRNTRWGDYLKERLVAHQVDVKSEVAQWLNELLPARGETDESWRTSLTEDQRSQLIVSWDEGSMTVGEFVDEFTPANGKPALYHSPGGGMIVNILESDIMTKKNLAEAKRRGLLEREEVARDVTKKVEEALLDRFREKLSEDKVVDEAAVVERYELVKENLMVEESVTFRMINLSDAKLIESVHDRAHAGESFEALARKNNNNQGLADQGGLFGPVPRARFNEQELAVTLFERLAPGEVSHVIASSTQGFMLVQLVKKDPAHQLSLEEARTQIEAALVEETKNSALDEWLEAKKADLGVKIFPEVLNLLSEGGETDAHS